MRPVVMRLNLLLKCDFGLRTRQAAVVQKVENVKKSREKLTQEIEDPEMEVRIRREQEELAKKQFQQQIFNLTYNDKNPNNFIKVKVNTPQQTSVVAAQQIVPLIVKKQPRPEKVLITGVRRKIQASLRKLQPVVKGLKGMYYFDALATVSSARKKAARFVAKALEQVKSHAVQQGYDEERLFIHSIIIGKYKRFRRARYHARAKIFPAIRDTTQVRITLEEMPAVELFKMMLRGKAPTGLAQQVKANLVDDASYEKVRSLQFILTAKGRQQQKMLLKRKMQQEWFQSKKDGTRLSQKYIFDKILNEEAERLVEAYEKKKRGSQKVSLESRQTLFKKNEELNI